MSFRDEDMDAFNEDVKKWTQQTLAEWKANMDALGIKHRKNSKSEVAAKKAVKTAIRKNAGMSSRISFRMPQHMIFLQKGVGRGVKIGQVSNSRRIVKDHLNPVLENRIDKLQEIAAEHYPSLIVNALMIK